METFRLKSMTDFVLNQKQSESFNEKTFINEALISLEKIRNYAKFLKQPLKLEMFVPCDSYDNVLSNPFADDNDAGTDKEYKQTQYNKAKEKVLFENVNIVQAKWLVNSFSTIESLSDISNTITPIYINNNAKKQI